MARICSKGLCVQPAEPGCNGRCAGHAVKTDRGERATYNTEHERLRVECFERDRWTCRTCGWCPQFVAEVIECVDQFGIEMMPTQMILDELKKVYKLKGPDRQWLESDHIFPATERPDLAYTLSNRQTLCNRCHYKKTKEYTERGNR